MKRFNEYVECCRMGGIRSPKLWLVILFLNDELRYGFCKLFGHTMVDTSMANGDTGYAAAHCTRCGYSFHERLY
jgi:hypothetical protein